MRRLTLFVVAAVTLGLLAAAPAGPAAADSSSSWPPLVNCPDVNGDGAVFGQDIAEVVAHFGGDYKASFDEYFLLYDLNGDGGVFGQDISEVVGDFGVACPLIESQVALATVATMQYRDCQDALADGYFQSTQFVPSMGIHLSKNSNVVDPGTGGVRPFWSGSAEDTNDQIRNPVGLICTDSDPDPNTDVPDKLIGMWYVDPNPEVCPIYGIDPGECDYIEPVGFGLTSSDEDNQDVDGFQRGWHTHPGLCVGGVGTESAFSQENTSESACVSGDLGACPCIWFSEYGWMAHLYNFIPNPAGRFLMWSTEVPPEP